MKLDDLKVGDKVVIWIGRGWYQDNFKVRAVERVLKNAVEVDGQKYSKSSGLAYGYSSNHLRIEPLTDEKRKELEDLVAKKEAQAIRDDLVRSCRGINFYSLTDDQLRQMLAIVGIEDPTVAKN